MNLPPDPAAGPGWLTATTPALGGPVVAVVLLAWAVRATHRAGGWRAGPATAWASGVAVVLVATVGPLGAYARALAWVQATQLLVLLLVAPALLALARPLALAQAAAARTARPSRAVAVVEGRPFRLASAPWLSPLYVPLALGALYATPLLLAADRHLVVRDAVELVLLLLGLLLAVGVLGDGVHDEPPELLGLAAGLGLLELLLDAVPGIAVRLAHGVLAAPYWLGLHRGWGPSPLADQHLAGAVLWGVGEGLDLPFLVVVVARWMRSDARATARIDAALDMAAPADSGAADPNGALLERPWWETDPGRLDQRAARWRDG